MQLKENLSFAACRKLQCTDQWIKINCIIQTYRRTHYSMQFTKKVGDAVKALKPNKYWDTNWLTQKYENSIGMASSLVHANWEEIISLEPFEQAESHKIPILQAMFWEKKKEQTIFEDSLNQIIYGDHFK